MIHYRLTLQVASIVRTPCRLCGLRTAKTIPWTVTSFGGEIFRLSRSETKKSSQLLTHVNQCPTIQRERKSTHERCWSCISWSDIRLNQSSSRQDTYHKGRPCMSRKGMSDKNMSSRTSSPGYMIHLATVDEE